MESKKPEVEVLEIPCPKCGRELYGYKFISWIWCSSYGKELPLEENYPTACGYTLLYE